MRRLLLVALLALGIVNAVLAGTPAAVAVWGKGTSACQTDASSDEDDTNLAALFQRAALEVKRLMPLR